MPEMSPTYNPPTVGRPGIVTPIEEQRLHALAELSEEMHERGYTPASVINLHPFKMHPSGVYHRTNITGVPLDDKGWDACPKLRIGDRDVPYTQHIYTRWEPVILEQVVGFEGNFQASVSKRAILPHHLAQDVIIQNNRPRTRGGMICYKGGHAPLSNAETRDAEMQLLVEAHAQQIAHYTELFEEAESKFADVGSKLNRWRELQYNRWATRYLRRMGIVAQDPGWLIKTVQVGAQPPRVCLSCGVEAKPGALRCTNGQCTYVFEPFEAFDKFVIGLDTPGAKLAFRRLSSEEVEKLIRANRFSLEQLDEGGFEPPEDTAPPRETRRTKKEPHVKPEPSNGNAAS